MTRFVHQKARNDGSLRVDYLPLSSLKPARRNPKKHQIDTVLTSMGRFGYVAPDSFIRTAIQFAITPDAAWYCWHASTCSTITVVAWKINHFELDGVLAKHT